MLTRINKYIAESGLASRRKAEDFILQKRVTVNDKVISNLSFKINPESDIVKVDGEVIRPKKNVYFLLNKPRGIISSTKDEKKRRTVVDLIESNEKLFPVGRLDYNTTGVLLLTNDGDFSNLLTHPKNNIKRVYQVKLDRPLTEYDKAKLLKGVYIERKRGKFTDIKLVKRNDKKFLSVECVEGRNHFVKNMFGALGYKVKQLERVSFAGIKADIPPGKYRKLKKEEIRKIINRYSN